MATEKTKTSTPSIKTSTPSMWALWKEEGLTFKELYEMELGGKEWVEEGIFEPIEMLQYEIYKNKCCGRPQDEEWCDENSGRKCSHPSGINILAKFISKEYGVRIDV